MACFSTKIFCAPIPKINDKAKLNPDMNAIIILLF
ncbi:hypothetical protein DR79_1754 [Francisella tularensis]|nr:hypothetical protein DR79_1754 [Francisella tularensis]